MSFVKAQTPLTLSLRELRSHRHRRALLNLLAALFSGFGSFQSWITTNEDGGNRADGASNEGEEEGVIVERRGDLRQHHAHNGDIQDCHQQAKFNHQRGPPSIREMHLFPPNLLSRRELDVFEVSSLLVSVGRDQT